MGHPSIVVLGYSEASALIRAGAGGVIKAAISIFGNRESPVETPLVPHRLELSFDDVDPAPSDPIAAFRHRQNLRRAEGDGLTSTPPRIEHAQAVIDFARSIKEMDGCVLCQCLAGISRSPAVALLCLATWTGRGREREAVETLIRIRPFAIPHQGLIAFGDAILDRGGVLIDAAKKISMRIV